jgi:hypothetical protein
MPSRPAALPSSATHSSSSAHPSSPLQRPLPPSWSSVLRRPISRTRKSQIPCRSAIQSTGPQPPAPVLTENRTPVLTQKPKPSQKPVLAENPILPQQVFPQPATQPTPHPQTDPAPSTTAPSIPATAATPNKIHKGSSPLPATRAEFAAQILKSLAPTPSIPTALNSTKPNPTATHQTQEQLSHLSSAHRPRRKRHHKRSAQRAPKPTHKQKKLPGKVAYQYARNRIPTPMGLDHRSITLPFTSTQSRDFLRR